MYQMYYLAARLMMMAYISAVINYMWNKNLVYKIDTIVLHN